MRRKATFIGLSVLVHVVAVVLLARWFGDDSPIEEQVVDRVTLLEPESPLPPRPTAVEPPATEEHITVPPAPEPRTALEVTRPVKVEDATTDTAVGPFESPHPPGPPSPPKKKLTAGMFKLSHDVLAKSVDVPIVEKHDPADVDAMLEGYFTDLKAQNSVKQGKYDPQLLAMRNAVEGQWDPDFDQIHDGPLAESPGKMLKTWKKSAETYGKTGSPIEEPNGPWKPDDWKPSAGVIDVKDQMDQAGAFTKRVALGVTIHFDGQGGWQIAGIQSSGYKQFDEAALTAIETTLKKNADSLPDEETTTKWAMEADFIIQPPLPVAGFSFDLALQHFEVGYPLKKKVKYRMKLLAVYTDEEQPSGKPKDDE